MTRPTPRPVLRSTKRAEQAERPPDWPTAAKRLHPEATKITGSGAWALVHQVLESQSGAAPATELRLFRSPDEAITAAKQCARAGCSRACRLARGSGLAPWVRGLAGAVRVNEPD
jgi:hypothetical protein